MSFELFASRRALARSFRALVDGIEFTTLLACYIMAMLVFAAFVRSWAPLHADTVEMAAWGRDLQLGYSKHPPLGAWVAGLWFSIMPATHWSAHLMATLVAAGGLVGVWKLAALHLDETGQRVAVLPLMLTPAFTIWAFKYNANAILLLTWPWTAYFALRVIETPTLSTAIMAGLMAALSILGKYYSAVLLASLALALLLHPKCHVVVRTPALYVAVGVFLLALAPHLWWVADSGASTVRHAASRLERFDAASRITTLRTLGAGVLTLLGLAGLLLWALGAEARRFCDRARRNLSAGRRQWVVALALGPLAFTMLAHVVAGARIANDFLLPVFFPVTFAGLVLADTPVPERALRRLTGATLSVLGMAALLSPVIGLVTFLTARHPLLEPRQELAAAVTDMWHGRFGEPLHFVAGQERLATSIAFYSADRPRYLDGGTPWRRAQRDETARHGLVLVCRDDDARCLDAVHQHLVGRSFESVSYRAAHTVLGWSGPTSAFRVFMIPPERR